MYTSLENPPQIIPDYTTGISKVFGTYTAEYSGVLIGNVQRNAQLNNGDLAIKINDNQIVFSSASYARIPIFLPIEKGDQYIIKDGGNISAYSVIFYKFK